ncbi:hypothetical protein AB1N83_013043 [Pleurotus pulmonarius]
MKGCIYLRFTGLDASPRISSFRPLTDSTGLAFFYSLLIIGLGCYKCFRGYTAPNQRISPIPWHVQPYELIPHMVLQRDHVDGAYRVYLVAFEPEQKITAGGLSRWRGSTWAWVDVPVAAMYTGGHAFHVAYDVLRVNNARDLSLDARDPRFHRLEKYFKKCLIIRRFRFVDGKQNVTTVADYFARENKPVWYPDVFGFITSRPNDAHKQVFPAEFCEVVKGQFLPEESSRGVQDFATARPTDRLRAIETGFLHKVRLPSPLANTSIMTLSKTPK